jgi:beta-glucuronidase
MRRQATLGGAWRFRPEDAAAPRPEAVPPAPDDTVGWRDVTVPAAWDRYAPDLDGFRGIGWFRKHFDWTASADEVAFLRFEAVNHSAEVWLNGKPVGSHEGGYTPFELEVTPHLRASNLLEVRVDNLPLAHRVPQADGCGWRNYGGIHREVSLCSVHGAHIAELSVRGEPLEVAGPADRRVAGGFWLSAAMRNALTRSLAGSLLVTVTDPAGRKILEQERPVRVAAGGRMTMLLTEKLGGVEAWSPEHPALYGVEATLRDGGGEEVDRVAASFGFRSILVQGDAILLNGRPVYLVGFNRHEQYGDTGPVDPGGMLERDLRDMKENLGANTVRCSHYPQHPRLYELCDRIGLMVIDEIPLYYDKQTARAMTDRRVVASARRQLEEMIRRDRNHPSVIAWSVANETATHLEGGRRTIAGLVSRARKLDPHRLVFHVSNKGASDKCFDLGDVICLNEYPGVFSPTDDVPGWFRAVHGAIRQAYPGKPIVLTEWGDWGLPGTKGPVRGSEENQAATLERVGVLLAAMPELRGMLLWCYADYLWPVERGIADPVRVEDWPANLRSFGVVDRFRNPKMAYEVVRRCYQGRAAPAVGVAEEEGCHVSETTGWGA